MFKFIKRWLTKEKWALVKTYTQSVTYNSLSGQVYYRLFESDRNNRKVDLTTNIDIHESDLIRGSKQTKLYNAVIYRWEHGNRNDPDIPRYADIPEEDVMHYLQGTIGTSK